MNRECVIRPVGESDLDRILALNKPEEKWVGRRDRSFFKRYLDLPHFLLAETHEDPDVAGFVMAMESSVDYESKNFLWFKERYERFLYIDRVVVSPAFRGRGIATALYNHLMERKKGPLVCEATIKPANEGSIIFHEKLGFKSVGTFSSDSKKVCTMYKLD